MSEEEGKEQLVGAGRGGEKGNGKVIWSTKGIRNFVDLTLPEENTLDVM